MLRQSEILDQKFEGPLKLRPQFSRFCALFFMGIFAAFWNGVVGMVFLFGPFQNLEGSVLFLLFLVPFAIIGLGLAVFFLYLLLGMFNPKVEIALTNGAVVLGDEVDVAWQVGGGFRSLVRLRIVILARESASYRQGTDLRTDEQVIVEIPLVDTTEREQIQFGTKTIRIPQDSMHSFDGQNNKIKWLVNVRGTIPWWPDIQEQFDFRVKPFGPSAIERSL